MILKYKDGNVWGYIDGVSQVGNEKFSQIETVDNYMDELTSGRNENLIDEYENGKPIDHRVYLSNIIFSEITEWIQLYGDVHKQNLINPKNVPIDKQEGELNSSLIVLYIEGSKEFDKIVLATNQECYLLNNEGKTIERLS